MLACEAEEAWKEGWRGRRTKIIVIWLLLLLLELLVEEVAVAVGVTTGVGVPESVTTVVLLV